MYSNFNFEIGEIQHSDKEHEFKDSITAENQEGFDYFDNSSQYLISFGDVGKYKDQNLKIEINNFNNQQINVILAINPLKNEARCLRLSKEMIMESGLLLCENEKVFFFLNLFEIQKNNRKKITSSLITHEFSLDNIEKVNLIIYCEDSKQSGLC